MKESLNRRLSRLEQLHGDGHCYQCDGGRRLAPGVRFAEDESPQLEPEQCPRCGRSGPMVYVVYENLVLESENV